VRRAGQRFAQAHHNVYRQSVQHLFAGGQPPHPLLVVRAGHGQLMSWILAAAAAAAAAAAVQGMSPAEYEAQKVAVADDICMRLQTLWPGLRASIEFREVRHTQPRWCQPGHNQAKWCADITHLHMPAAVSSQSWSECCWLLLFVCAALCRWALPARTGGTCLVRTAPTDPSPAGAAHWHTRASTEQLASHLCIIAQYLH
jgi:hypothetical protein